MERRSSSLRYYCYHLKDKHVDSYNLMELILYLLWDRPASAASSYLHLAGACRPGEASRRKSRRWHHYFILFKRTSYRIGKVDESSWCQGFGEGGCGVYNMASMTTNNNVFSTNFIALRRRVVGVEVRR